MQGFQYETGKEYEEKEAIKACYNGFHFCENPFDVFSYYPPSDGNGENRYCEVEASGTLDKEVNGDSKVASSKLKIKAEIGLNGIIKAGIDFILEKIDWRNNASENTGNRSAATNTGNWSAATNTGYQSAATNTGDQSLQRTPVTSQPQRTPVTSQLQRTPVTGQLQRTPVTGQLQRTPVTGQLQRTPVTGQLQRTPVTGQLL
ncbi:DUF7666 domain-containing protein [Parabacteroides chongii]|uniref:DUF7666 domain-containing protein n=1 Tax=Parabacteroides chongii TaxID=2685834 RepID=UPI00240F6854|nr:hypothetical protein [Parabacteroides chongii]WFE87242.1 hypothetical protein P3L47_23615 [Parabacteroides chongii]